MPRTYFADAWWFIAAIDRFDSHYSRARAIRDRLAGQRNRVVSHYGVLTEVLAFFSKEGSFSRARAVASVRSALVQFEIRPVDRALFHSALDLYAARPDKEYSLVDCTSMVIMKSFGIQHVLTNDHHFSQEGFTVVSE